MQDPARPPIFITIDDKFLGLCGSGSLIGTLLKENNDQWPTGSDVVLRFH